MNSQSPTFLSRAACLGMAGLLALSLAACGGGGGSAGETVGTPKPPPVPVPVDNTKVVGEISLIFSSPELKSAGVAGTEVAVTALIKSAANTAIPDVPVTFSATSGALSAVSDKSDASGQAKATLSTSGDRTNRTITVTVKAGDKTVSGTIDVVGTSVSGVGPSTITANSSGDFVITVRDSNGIAVPNVPVTIASARGNPIAVKTSGGTSGATPKTTSQGQVVIGVTASNTGTDTLTFSSQGASTTTSFNVNSSRLTALVHNGAGTPVSTSLTGSGCQPIAVSYDVGGVAQNGTVNVSTSRGTIYADALCSTVLTSSNVSVTGGQSAPTYVRSTTAGVATITATIPNGPTAQTTLEFVALLTPAATISVQAEPAVIGANSGTGQTEVSTLTAVVRDGTLINNFVKNAVVEFSLVKDGSGGALSNPSVVTTGSNGAASVVFVAGTAVTEANGVQVQAKIQGTSTVASTFLTVTKKSLFIAAGTGNKVLVPTDTTYQQDYSVFVTDAAGNPVPDVSVTASVIPTSYQKGFYQYDDIDAKAWVRLVRDTCGNEDVNQNGILDANEDANLNGKLDPGIPLSVTSSGKTDATGTAKISILYPRDRSVWTEVRVTFRGTVQGTESTYITAPYRLPILATDVSTKEINPPGVVSPYGVGFCSSPN